MSTGVRAIYYDGRTSRAREVTLRFANDGTLTLEDAGAAQVFARSQVSIESRLGNGPRFVRLPDDQRCEVTDNEALDKALKVWPSPGAAAWLHRVEQSWRLVALSVVVLLALGWLVFAYGLPWGAKRVAFMLPDGIVNSLGDQTLATFDRALFKPSTLETARRDELRAKFDAFLKSAGDHASYRIEFRASPRFGANAFALPSGVIVMTDELVKLAKTDEEIIAVVAHECGHVKHRHILRSVLQNSAVVLTLALVTGDVSSTTAIGGALPGYLMQSRFSREFETEADSYAIETMKRAGMPTLHLANILERLEHAHGHGHDHGDNEKPSTDGAGTESGDKSKSADYSEMLDYISSHPSTRERVKTIRDADTQPAR